MDQGTTEVNIASAASLTQFCLLLVVCTGAVILRYGEPNLASYRDKPGPSISGLAWVILLLALISLGPLLLSESLSASWLPLFTGLPIPTIPNSKAMFAMFMADILGIGWLVGATGGSRASAFSPILLTLPALAIFLREPLDRLIIYAGSIALLFAFLMVVFRNAYKTRYYEDPPQSPADGLAFYVVSCACLGITTAIGYITRPK